MKHLLLFLFLSVVMAGHSLAALSMPHIFADHMVLQSGKAVKLWGQADTGAEIVAAFKGNTVKAEADEEGAWSLLLPEMEASADGAVLKVSSGQNTLEFKDVLLGEVWFASGQSNMVWSLKQIQATETITSADQFPEIRFFQAASVAEGSLQEDVDGQWSVSNSQRAANFSAVAYYFAKRLHDELDVPVGIIQAAWGGKPVEAFTRRDALLSVPEGKAMMEKQDQAIADFDEQAAQERYKAALREYETALSAWEVEPEATRAKRGPRKPKRESSPGHNPNAPATIYNGMIHPLVGYSIRGVIWYQGESNAKKLEQAGDYGSLFALKIRDWREQWGDDFRYLWVQLANFKAPVVEPGANAPWAVVQEHQRRTLALPKTGMAVINDIGDAKNIHPRNKKDVGERLARWALADEYGKDVIASGPLYASHVIEGEQITVDFDYVGKGLKSRNGEVLQHFEIQDEEGQWYWADASIDGDQIIVTHPEVKLAAAVRYAWSINPEAANLVNSEGLPASLFTTEWDINAGQAVLPVDGKALVTYQAAPLEKPKGGDSFKGSNFIHPLKTPSGFIVTGSQPEDHAHHFGLWWPWKFISVEGRQILCWELQKGDGIVEAREAKPIENGLVTKSVYIDRKAAEGPAVRLHETTTLQVSDIVDQPAKGYFLDITIAQEVAGDKPITVEQFRYSGFGYRGAEIWNKNNSTVLTSRGLERNSTNASPAHWVRIQGTNGLGGSAGLLMMGHPDNRAHPEKLRTWDDRFYNGAVFINFNPVMDEPWVFEPGQTYTRSYRLFVYDGELSKEAAEAIWKAYSES